MIVVGAVAGWFYDRRADRTSKPEAAKQLGVLLASGLIVGEGIIQVVIAVIKSLSSKPAPLALVGPGFETAGIILGGVTFAAIDIHSLSLDFANGAGEIDMKRRWNWPIWVGFVVAVGGLFSLRVLRAVSDHARFSVGESFALWNWRCVVARRSVPRVWPAATLSRQNFRLDLRSDCCARCSRFSVTKSSTSCDRCPLPTGAPRVGAKGAGLFTAGSKWKACRSRRFAFAARGTQRSLIFYRGFW